MINNYYQKHQERLWKEARKNIKTFSEKKKTKGQKKVRERYRNLTEKQKGKKLKYHRELNKNLSEEQKKKLDEYRINYHITHNKTFELLFRFFKNPGTISFVDQSLKYKKFQNF